jgi:predicted metal-dependent hydrolase
LKLREKVVERSGEGKFKFDEPIETLTFKVSIGYQENPKIRVFGARLVDGVLQINMPVGVDIETDVAQNTLKRIVSKFLRMEAERVLPEKMEYWSKQCALDYHSLKIDTAKSRWGCCSSRKEIKLSYYLLLLPERLIDYVIVHELCHTREMNHGPRFKSLLHSFFNDYVAIELVKPKWDRKVSWLKL